MAGKKKKEEPAPPWPDEELKALNLRQLKEMVLALRKDVVAAQREVTEAATDRVRVGTPLRAFLPRRPSQPNHRALHPPHLSPSLPFL